jgi:hypothetical protein
VSPRKPAWVRERAGAPRKDTPARFNSYCRLSPHEPVLGLLQVLEDPIGQPLAVGEKEETSGMSPQSRLVAGILLIVLPTVEIGGASTIHDRRLTRRPCKPPQGRKARPVLGPRLAYGRSKTAPAAPSADGNPPTLRRETTGTRSGFRLCRWRSARVPNRCAGAFFRNIETRRPSGRAFAPCLSPSLKARVAAETDEVRVA